ncbi:MAG TPA: FAD-dependent oxidoreductase [Ktedonobacteraceae bacterium]|nr:FAD-dependent oxidoreductase [Ktedonobacteraceae bacterium]
MTEQYVVIGNGIAGVTAAEILRTEDASAEITVIADDPFPVYYRPALKDYLAGRVREDKLWARPTSFYQDQNIRFLSARVNNIQAGQHRVLLSNGREASYSRLLLACGARASNLRCPGIQLTGVTTLRTVSDYQAVQKQLPEARRVVVSGSGTLALETIETLRHRGFAVTHLVRKRTLWSDILDSTASDLVLQQERRDGVDVRLEDEIAEITGKSGKVTGVVTTSGARISCEIVLIAIGVEPIVDFIHSSGIPCERGVKVDAAMRTAAPDIYAAGDVLEVTDTLSGRQRVIGQWYPAVQQARAAAYSMLDLLDTSLPFSSSTFYNATFLYGLDFASVGLTQAPRGASGYQELVADPQPRIYRKVLLKDGIAVGMLGLGERTGVLAFKRAIDHKVNLAPVASRLFSSDFKLGAWLDQQGVPPTQFSVSREGAVAVRKVASTIIREAQPAVRGDAYLVPAEKNGEFATRTLLSQTKLIIVGRQAGVSLLIDHASVSRRHAEIAYAERQYILRDAGSSNGTFVNGVRLAAGSAHLLSAGDAVRFGKIDYIFQLEQPAKKMQTQLTFAGTTRMIERATGFYNAHANGQAVGETSQPQLNADGSLLLPGASEAVPANLAATLKSSPALVAVIAGRPQIFYLKPGKTAVLGRDKQNEVALPDMSASRKHAEVFSASDGFYVRDLHSSNGVEVNSTRIDNPYHLEHGDRIVVGSTTVYFINAQSSATVEVPLAVATRFCPRCGTAINETAQFCTRCGTSLKQLVPGNV